MSAFDAPATVAVEHREPHLAGDRPPPRWVPGAARQRSWLAWALTYLYVFRRIVVGLCFVSAGVGLAEGNEVQQHRQSDGEDCTTEIDAKWEAHLSGRPSGISLQHV